MKKSIWITVACGCAMAQMPASHPKESGPLRASRSELTARMAGAASHASLQPVPIRNYIDRYIFETSPARIS